MPQTRFVLRKALENGLRPIVVLNESLDSVIVIFTQHSPVAEIVYRTSRMENIFFGGKLPRFLGFDVGPIRLRGGRATEGKEG